MIVAVWMQTNEALPTESGDYYCFVPAGFATAAQIEICYWDLTTETWYKTKSDVEAMHPNIKKVLMWTEFDMFAYYYNAKPGQFAIRDKQDIHPGKLEAVQDVLDAYKKYITISELTE